MGVNAASVISVQIPPNERSSGVADLGGTSLVAIEMPEAFNGTTLTFQAKAKRRDSDHPGVGDPNPEDWDDVYDSAGNQITWTVGAGRVVVPTAAHEAAMRPLRFIRIVAGTNQNPGREIRLICKSS